MRTAVLLLALLVPAPAVADELEQQREIIGQGNELYAAGKYAEALERYASIERPDPRVAAELLFDQAAAHYMTGQLDEARELWTRAAPLRDARFEAACRYNLGNCDYAAALQALQKQDTAAAGAAIEKAMANYADALRLRPDFTDARANLELAAQLKKMIEQIQQQQQQQQSGQKNEDQQKQDQQSCDQPSQGDQQQNKRQQSDSQDQQSPDQPRPDQQQSPQQQDQSQADEQQTAGQQPDQAEQRNEQSGRKMKVQMTREEALRLLQRIRDAERQRRQMLRRLEAAKQKPVEKDW